ncbi:MAG: hypothetical protein ABFC89_11150 [Methanospirillum sp.]
MRNSGAAGTPAALPMVDLLRLADAFSRMDRLAVLVAARTRGDRQTVILEILGGLQDHLDATAPVGTPRGVEETVEAIRVWFDGRIVEEEGRPDATE